MTTRHGMLTPGGESMAPARLVAWLFLIRQRLHYDVLVVDFAARVVALQGEGAGAEEIVFEAAFAFEILRQVNSFTTLSLTFTVI